MMNCVKCHGWKELDYHPGVYKTVQCNNGKNCKKQSQCTYFHDCKDRRYIILLTKRFKQSKQNQNINCKIESNLISNIGQPY